MGKINKVLLMIIAMVVIMVAAVGIDRGAEYLSAKKWEKERVARYEQAYADVYSIRSTIEELSQDQEMIEAFIEENKEYFEGLAELEVELSEQADYLEQDGIQESISGNETVSGNESVSGNGTISGNENLLEGGTVSDNEILTGSDSISGNSTISGNGSVSGNETVSGNDTVSGNESVSGNGILSGNETVSDNSTEGQDGILTGSTLQEKRKIRSSYMETAMQNEIDLQIIEENEIDFSDISIACLGDSITDATNLEDLEDYHQYAYPTRLQEWLEAQDVTNLGIGGSSIGRYWDKAFVERYQDIPEDTDLILVMGGTNDGFCVTQEELGSLKDREERTFYGDLDGLMQGLKEDYPEATIIFMTPLPNVLHDVLRKERDYLLPQSVFANAIKQLAAEYGYPVIDLYNSNILDSHDAAVIYNYMPDGVHCNPAGYDILAQHLAAEIIQIYENETPST